MKNLFPERFHCLYPQKGWTKRNAQFWQKNVIPSLFKKRGGQACTFLDDIAIKEELWINWIGHSSFWIQMGGSSFMIDPNWAMWHGPLRRLKQPGVALVDMPLLDFILVSHAHYDHLHKKSLKYLQTKSGILLPKGCASLLKNMPQASVQELEVGEITQRGALSIEMTPVKHWGARFLHDTHRASGAFLLSDQKTTLFHAGDSAYFEGFKALGEQHHIDVALLPIGAYGAPSGRDVHMNPEEALQTFLDLKARWFIPMHYDTFPLGTEKHGEPLLRLIAEAKRLGILSQILLPTEGVPLRIKPPLALPLP